MECLATILFVTDFLWEQVESIQTNSTLVETYQRTHGKQTTVGDHFRTVFGHQQLLWFIPVVSAPTPDYAEGVVKEQDSDPWPSQYDDDGDLGIAGTEFEGFAEPRGGRGTGQVELVEGTRLRRPGAGSEETRDRQADGSSAWEWRRGPG